ncbi:MAG TPA: PQQ-binding-like beta-propeller repeat protein [Trebonia sp.]|nr:PQQ-binding-like beta-propeller repeat protein [Trebonia sp.]
MGQGRVLARRRRSRAARVRQRLAAFFRSRRVAARRVALAAALLVVVLVPIPVLASDTSPRSPACAGSDCLALAASAERWAVPLAGYWSAGTGPGTTGDGGTVPVGGQAAYVAVGGGLAVVGTGLTLTGYAEDTGKERWNTTLTAPAGAQIISVRAWPGVITAGLLAPDGRSRTEVVLNAATGRELRHYPAGVFGGAVTASGTATVVIGLDMVTSYGNATGRVRWQRATTGDQSWQADGQTLYLAQAPGGYLSSSPVTALKVVNLKTGAERVLGSPLGQPFSGTLAMAADGAVLFASPAGVTAYSGSTGGMLWKRAGWVPEGADPAVRQVDFTVPGGALVGADPLTGHVRAAVPAATATGAAAVYVVRGGMALGLDSGANGDAWVYDMASGKVLWTSSALPWPHFFSDPSGLGGSAAASGNMVVVTACPHLAASQGICADPELVAFKV